MNFLHFALLSIAISMLSCTQPDSPGSHGNPLRYVLANNAIYRDTVNETRCPFVDFKNLQTIVTPESITIKIEVVNLKDTVHNVSSIYSIDFSIYIDINKNYIDDVGDYLLDITFPNINHIGDSLCFFDDQSFLLSSCSQLICKDVSDDRPYYYVEKKTAFKISTNFLTISFPNTVSIDNNTPVKYQAGIVNDSLRTTVVDYYP
jgi:hypothetical protein